MYLELFKLHELPFRLSPDPQFLYLSKQHARAKAYMESTIWFTDGFVVITGEIGAGKTTLIETFLRELQTDAVVAQINQTQLSPTAFLQTVLVQFGFSPFNMKKPEVLATLNQFLMEQHINGRKVLLIIDEAQNLSHRVLEEVRMLSGIETTKEKVLRIILAGQPELNDKLNSPGAGAAHATRAPAFSSDRAHRGRDHRLHRPSSRGGRLAGTAHICRGHLRHDLQIHRRRAAPDQHAVRHLPDGRVRPRQGHGGMRGSRRRDRANCSGSNSPPAPIACAFPIWSTRCRRTRTSGHTVGRILLASDGKTVMERELKPGRLVIGRTSDNDLQIDSKFISRHHCQIVTQPDSCLIEDLNSTNGIFVQSKRVRRHNLNDGDVVQVGQHEIMYIDERAPRVRTRVRTADGDATLTESPKSRLSRCRSDGRSMVSPQYSRLNSR